MHKVYCKNCRYYDLWADFRDWTDSCAHPDNFVWVDTPTERVLRVKWWAIHKNKNNDCELFELPTKRTPWWRIWRKNV
jgi:hypothetical protein